MMVPALVSSTQPITEAGAVPLHQRRASGGRETFDYTSGLALGRRRGLGRGGIHCQARPLVTLLYLLAFLCPPLAVYLDIGAGPELRLNIILTILGWIPGVIHALYILSIHPPH